MVTNDRAELRLRVPTELRDQVKRYADQLGVPINAAAILLLNEALRREHERRGQS